MNYFEDEYTKVFYPCNPQEGNIELLLYDTLNDLWGKVIIKNDKWYDSLESLGQIDIVQKEQ